MLRRFFTCAVWLLAVPLFFPGCSSENDYSFSPDPTCGRSYDFILDVTPEGAGRVEKTSYVNSEGLNGLMPFQVIQLFAIPNEGYQFVDWDAASLSVGSANPLSLVPCNMSSSLKTIRITAVFEPTED